MKLQFVLAAAVCLLVGCDECNTCIIQPFTIPHDTSTSNPVSVWKRIHSKNDVKGPVQMIISVSWNGEKDKKTGVIIKGEILDSNIYYYDRQGNNIESYLYCGRGKPTYFRHDIRKYDKNNNMIYNALFDENGDTMFYYYNTYQYDEVGNLICVTKSNATESSKLSYKYFFSNDSIVIHTYDDTGALQNRDVLDTTLRYLMTYDHLAGKSDWERRLYCRTSYRYYPDGKLQEGIREDAYGKYVTIYDTNGYNEHLDYHHKRICNTEQYRGLKLDCRRTGRYIEYDSHGNWIRAITSYEDKEDLRKKTPEYTIVERKIFYY